MIRTKPKCKFCRKPLGADNANPFLHDSCVDEWIAGQRAKMQRAKAKVERASVKVRKDKLKSKSDWAREAQIVVNKYVRLRDASLGRGCVSCGARPEQKWGGTMDAGHLRSVGSAPHLRFYLPQISSQCVTCNRYKGGMALAFRRTLVERHGNEWVETLEAMQGLAKFDIPYYQRIKAIFSKKCKRLEKAAI